MMAARPKESLQEKKRKKLRVTSPTLEQVSAPSLECLVCGTDEGVIILFCSSGVVQRTSSNKVCLIKATEPFLNGECAFGFGEKRLRGVEGQIFYLSTWQNFLAINSTFTKCS